MKFVSMCLYLELDVAILYSFRKLAPKFPYIKCFRALSREAVLLSYLTDQIQNVW